MYVMPIAPVKAGEWKDDFSDKKMKNWKPIVGDWQIVDGTMAEILDAGIPVVPQGENGNVFRVIARSDWDFADGTIEVQVEFNSNARFSNDAVVLYRLVDPNNGYATRLQLDDVITVGKMLNEQYEHIKIANVAVEPGIWYKVKVEAIGDKIRVSVNDEEKLEVTDSTFRRGKVGLGASRINEPPIFFDDIKVSGKGVGGPESIRPRGKLTSTWARIKHRF